MVASVIVWLSCLLAAQDASIEPPPAKITKGRPASGGPLIPEQAAYDVSHYDLTLSVDPAEQKIAGTLAVTAKVVARLDRLVLDLDDALTVSQCRSEQHDLAFKQRGGLLAIALGKWYEPGSSFTVAVTYGGKPRVAPHAPWDGGFTWAKTPSGKPWIATTCQMDGADLWWPCKDHPSDKAESFDLRVTVPGDLVCAANGKLVDQTDDKSGTRTFHWRLDTPVSNYCIALNIAPYELIRDEYTSTSGVKIPVFFYVLPEDLEKGRTALPAFLRDMRVFEELCGPYPFRAEKYGVAETPHLGMEHATITAYGNQFRADPDGYDWLHNHEFAHEWWANLVTCRDWKDMWIHEGIGTYMQPLFLERTRGRDAYFAEMKKNRRFPNRRAIAPREVQNSREIYGNDIYNKGAWFMHELRWLMGDDKFFVALRRMAYPDAKMESVTDGTQIRFSDTDEMRAIVEKVYGKDLAWVFDVYLRQPDLPELLVQETASELNLTWKAPNGVTFPMPVPVRVNGALKRVEMPDGHAVVPLEAGAKVEIDPEGWLLRKDR